MLFVCFKCAGIQRAVGCHVTLLSASLHHFQELGAVSLDGYFHLWKAENSLCKVKHRRLQFHNCLPQLFYADRNHSNAETIPVTVSFFSASFCPPSCLTAKRMCAWPMGRTGRCMLWALSPMFPSWIPGSRRTPSSLSALERKEVVSGL